MLEDGVILKSQANLAAALKADWSAEARRVAKRILAQISAMQAGEKMMELKFTAPAPPDQMVDVSDALMQSSVPSGGDFACSMIIERSRF